MVLTALVGFIAWIDYQTGPRFSFSLFYLIPVAVAGWYLQFRPALLIAVVASLATVVAEVLWNTSRSVAYWNGFTSFTIFVLTTWLAARQRQARVELEAATTREARLARIDPITRLPNSRAFNELLSTADTGAPGDPQSVAILFIDLDNFKRVNDLFGHASGDDVLQKVAEAIVQSIRPDDVAARLGGDEFGVLARDVTPETAQQLGESIVRRIHELAAVAYPDTGLGATVGISYTTKISDASTLVDAADQAMYEGKTQGKNRVVFRNLRGAM